MRKYLLLVIFVSIAELVFSQINKYGAPLVTNFSPQEYDASEQNWSIVQDKRGVMYFGNNDNGILEYDGEKWRKIPVPNSSIVRSLAIDTSGVVYAGVVGDFGLLKTDLAGNVYYHSLKYLVQDTVKEFSDVWKTYVINGIVYFCSVEYIFRYDGKTVSCLPQPPLVVFTFLIDTNLYVGDYKNGLRCVNHNFKIVQGGGFYSKKGIYTIDKFNNEFLIGTNPEGLFFYNPMDGNSSKAFENTPADNFLMKNTIYHSEVNKKNLFFATIMDGLISFSADGNIINHLNKHFGLQDETIIYIKSDRDDNVWMGLNTGISRAEIHSPFAYFNDKQGLNGQVLDICEFQNKIFVATMLGVYYLDYDELNEPLFKEFKEIKDQTWSLILYNQHGNKSLLAGTIAGIYEINPDLKVQYIDPQIRSKRIKEGSNYVQILYSDPLNSGKVYVGLANGLFSMAKLNGSWQRLREYNIEGIGIKSLFIHSDGDLWAGTNYNGIMRFVGADTLIKFKFTTQQGLPADKDISVSAIEGKLRFGTTKGIYYYNSDSNKFFPDARFAGIKGLDNQPIFVIREKNASEYWFSAINPNHKYIERVFFNDSLIVEDSTVFRRLPDVQYDAIYHDSKGITWLGCSLGLFSFNDKMEFNPNKKFHVLIRKVTTVKDSLLFAGTFTQVNAHGDTVISVFQPGYMQPDLAYNSNDITFEFAAPYYTEEKKTLYSYYLDGYHETWSNWNKENKAVFTNLHEGKYTFKVKARNVYGIESEMATYQFSIQSPWYRTILAYFIYGLLVIIIMVIIVKLYTRKLKLEKIRLEGIVMERTAEIRKQKEAIEEQNVVLHEQKEEILRQKEEITSSIIYAKRIQRAIVPSEEQASCLLKDYFLLWRPRDIVSGDFWWLGEKNGLVIAAAADCTGHGVPGAFMSMLGVSFLNKIVNQRDNTQSNEILNLLRRKVKSTLGQTGKEGEAKDGMDIALLVIDYNQMTLQYSGAYNPLYLYRQGQLEVYKADRNPIGIYIAEKDSFTQNIIPLQKGDTLYIFSDGYIDQFGGEKGDKLTQKRFKEVLDSVQNLSMPEQRKALDQFIDKWRGDTEQIDDIIILGIKI